MITLAQHLEQNRAAIQAREVPDYESVNAELQASFNAAV